VQRLLDWLGSLPGVALYAALAATAMIENVFPPFPSDVVVAFGSFLAARGQATLAGVYLSTLAGNLAGALLMYWVGRRFGASVLGRIPGFKGEEGQKRLEELYERRGMVAIFFSRFLPAVRAIVPPFAGAAKLPLLRTALAMGSASAIWYGVITFLAYRAGSNWEEIQRRLGSVSRIVGIGATAIAVVAVVIWYVRRGSRGGARE
jgi:membrane protein DedA with SNARE-associated domain